MAYLEQKPHRGFCSKTLMLQVRFAHPPNPAPSYRFFVLFSKTHDLQVRFAHPPSPRRNLLSEGSGVSHGLFCDSAPSPIRALVFRSAYSASRNARASAAFAASIEAHCAVSSETLMLQVRFAHPPNCAPLSRFFVLFSKMHDLQVRFAHPPSPHRNLLSEGSGVSHGLFSSDSAPRCLL